MLTAINAIWLNLDDPPIYFLFPMSVKDECDMYERSMNVKIYVYIYENGIVVGIASLYFAAPWLLILIYLLLVSLDPF